MVETFGLLVEAGVPVLAVGQYLRPSEKHLPVVRYWRPDEFTELSGPPMRSDSPMSRPARSCAPPNADLHVPQRRRATGPTRGLIACSRQGRHRDRLRGGAGRGPRGRSGGPRPSRPRTGGRRDSPCSRSGAALFARALVASVPALAAVLVAGCPAAFGASRATPQPHSARRSARSSPGTSCCPPGEVPFARARSRSISPLVAVPRRSGARLVRAAALAWPAGLAALGRGRTGQRWSSRCATPACSRRGPRGRVPMRRGSPVLVVLACSSPGSPHDRDHDRQEGLVAGMRRDRRSSVPRHRVIGAAGRRRIDDAPRGRDHRAGAVVIAASARRPRHVPRGRAGAPKGCT